MKSPTVNAMLAWACLSGPAAGAEVLKSNNPGALNLPASWVSAGPPGTDDVAVWDNAAATVTNTTLGASMIWNGIRVVTWSVGPTIRPTSGLALTLDAAGVDMSAAACDFTVNAALQLGANQSWNITAGRTFTAAALSASTGMTLTKTGNGALSLNGATTYSGGLQINAGTVQVVNASGTQTLAGPLSGSGPLNKTGAGALALAADNSAFTGPIGLAAGQLNLNHPLALGGATLTIAGGALDNTSGAPVTLAAGSLQNWDGNFTFVGTASLNLGGSTVNVNGHRTLTVSGGVLVAGGVVTGADSLAKAGAGTLEVPAGGNLDMGGKLAVSGGTLRVAGGTVACGTMTFSPLEIGGGGTVALDGGTLKVGSVTRTSATATVRFNGGTLRPVSDSGVFMGGLDAAHVSAGGAKVDLDGWWVTIAQPLLHDPALGATPDGGLTLDDSFINGKLTLTGASTYTGPTLVRAGTLTLGAGGSIAASPLIEVQANAIFDAGSGATVAAGQTIQGTGSVTGMLTVGAGGTLAPGGAAIGTLTAPDTLTLAGNASFQVDKTGALLTSDAVTGMLRVNYGGTLTVTATGAALTNGNTFKLFDAAEYHGGFDVYQLPVLPAGLFWETSSLPVDGTIKVVDTVPSPTFDPPAGGYTGALSITIGSIGGSTIHYTTDGSDPRTSPSKVTAPSPVTGVLIPVDSTDFTIKAYAVLAPYTSSPVVTAVYTTLSTGVWTMDGSGNWSDTANWLLGAVADGSAIGADFSTLTLSSSPVVTLDGSRTVGHLRFGDLGDFSSWTLQANAGSTLTLDNGAATPVIHVENRTATITAPFASGNGLLKTGHGVMVAGLPNPITGGTLVRNGEIRIDKTGSLGVGVITLGDALTGDAEVRIAQRGSDPWPPTDARCTNDLFVAAGPTGRIVIARQNSGNYAGIYTGTVTLANNVVFRNDGGDRLAIEGRITGTGNVTVEGLRVNWDNNANNFVGDVIIASGCLLQINGNTVIPATSDVTANGTFGFNSGSATSVAIGGLNGTGVVSVPYGGGACTLTVGSQDRSGSFSGVIQNNVSLVKTGTGSQVLAGDSSTSGTTTVNAGSLLLNNTSGSATGSGSIAVNATAILGGTGSAAGSVVVHNGGTLAPGSSGAGTLTTGPLTIAGTWECQIDGAACDTVAVNGNLNLSGATLLVSTLAAPTTGTYVIATFTGTRIGQFASVPDGCTVDYTTPHQVRLTVPTAGYASWVGRYNLTGADALPDADPDLDGLDNAIEFVVGGNPATVQDQALLPTVKLVTNPGGGVPNGSYALFTFRRTPESAYLNPGIYYDADLAAPWTAAAGTPGVVQVVTPGFYQTPTPADRVEVYVPRAGNELNGRLFGRLQVTVP